MDRRNATSFGGGGVVVIRQEGFIQHGGGWGDGFLESGISGDHGGWGDGSARFPRILRRGALPP